MDTKIQLKKEIKVQIEIVKSKLAEKKIYRQYLIVRQKLRYQDLFADPTGPLLLINSSTRQVYSKKDQ